MTAKIIYKEIRGYRTGEWRWAGWCIKLIDVWKRFVKISPIWIGNESFHLKIRVKCESPWMNRGWINSTQLFLSPLGRFYRYTGQFGVQRRLRSNVPWMPRSWAKRRRPGKNNHSGEQLTGPSRSARYANFGKKTSWKWTSGSQGCRGCTTLYQYPFFFFS